jgi:hypothetical protein
MTTPKPVSPVTAWGLVGPDGDLFLKTVRWHEHSSWDAIALSWKLSRAEAEAEGYRAVKLRVEVVE